MSSALTTPTLDLTFIAPRRVAINVGRVRHAQIILAGGGGTGSFLALHLARLAYHARQQHGIEVDLTIVDPDTVEERNVGRQNFVPAEIGRHKAETLAVRYGRAFGLPVRFFNQAINYKHIDDAHQRHDGWLHLLIGAVDSVAARRDLEAIAGGWNSRLWWLDCGNHHADGQVLLGNSFNVLEPRLGPLGCTALPLPSHQHPELVEPAEPAGQDCALDALADVQSLMVNQQVAGLAASYVYRLLITNDLDTYATYFDLLAGSMHSRYIEHHDQLPRL